MISKGVAVLRPFATFSYDMPMFFIVVAKLLLALRRTVAKLLATVTLNRAHVMSWLFAFISLRTDVVTLWLKWPVFVLHARAH